MEVSNYEKTKSDMMMRLTELIESRGYRADGQVVASIIKLAREDVSRGIFTDQNILSAMRNMAKSDCKVDYVRLFEFAKNESMKNVKKSEGFLCLKCDSTGYVTLKKEGYETAFSCNCSLGKKRNLTCFIDGLDKGYEYTDNSEINMESYSEYQTATLERRKDMTIPRHRPDIIRALNELTFKKI